MSSHSDQLSAQIAAALVELVAGGEISISLPVAIPLERPKNRDHGDYASSIALQVAKSSGRPPREIAELLKGKLEKLADVAAVDIAGPGFINITLERASQAEVVRQILEAGAGYGSSKLLDGININLEFISANPTGPIHLGHTR